MTAALPDHDHIMLRVAGRYIFGIEIPWLPAIAGTDPLTARQNAFGRQIAMLRALGESTHDGTGTLQLRMIVDERTDHGRASSVIRIILLGAANKPQHAHALRERVLMTLPPEFAHEDADISTLKKLLDVDDEATWRSDSVAEIRRAIESSDPEADAGEGVPMSPVLLRWTWTWVNLVASLGALHKMSNGSQLIVHLEPRGVSPDALGFLREQIAYLSETYEAESGDNPLLAAVVNGYRQWLRDLPRVAVHLRVVIACPDHSVPVGIPEIIGADLTRSWETGSPVGTFDVIRPKTKPELDNALSLVQLMYSQPVRPPGEVELAELLHLFDPHEASAAFRIPVPGPEGLPGIRTEPVSMLSRGLASAVTSDDHAIVLGSGPSGDTVSLAHDEINKHVLVAGLPGYGKTTTVQSILRQLWSTDAKWRVPFLVLDPAKTDYKELASQLGSDCDLIELGSSAVAFNPLRCPDDVPTSTFATRVAAAFDATYDLSSSYPAAATVLTRAVHRTLAEDLPTLPRLYANVRALITNSAYSERVKGDLEAALTNRLELLTDGSLGNALMGSANAGIDWGRLLSRPTIVLTREFAGPRERALLMSLLLAGLVSYREYHPASRRDINASESTVTAPGALAHVTVVEEAHRILSNGRASGFVNDGAQAFVDAMAELRGAGEGFIVVEQAPSRLVAEVRKLVGTVIAHRTVDAEERSTLASSLTLPTSDDALAQLRPGQAVVLAANMLSPAVVTVEPGTGRGAETAPRTSRTLSGDEAVLRLWCQDCPVACTGYAGALAVERAWRRGSGSVAWTDAFQGAVASGLRGPELYCAGAFAQAQQATDAAEWDEYRRDFLKVYEARDKTDRKRA